MGTPACKYKEKMFVDLIVINLYDKSPMQTILYQFKRDMSLWKKLKCPQFMHEPGGKQWQHHLWGWEYSQCDLR